MVNIRYICINYSWEYKCNIPSSFKGEPMYVLMIKIQDGSSLWTKFLLFLRVPAYGMYVSDLPSPVLTKSRMLETFLCSVNAKAFENLLWPLLIIIAKQFKGKMTTIKPFH